MAPNLLVPQRFQLIWSRSVKSIRNRYHNYNFVGNERRYELIRYYPKDKSVPEDPEVPNPPKAFRVQRIVGMKGLPFWERRILKDFGLIYNAGTDVAIVKNIPENNARLWQIKHLVAIDAIVFPHGEPTENDIKHTFLKENGECVVTKKIAIEPARLEAAEEFIKDKTRLDRPMLKRDALLKWLRGT